MNTLAYDKVNGLILGALDNGVIPWVKPWSSVCDKPKNFATGHEYSGANFFLLSLLGGTSPYFLTFKQVNDLGGSVKAGSKAIPVIYWNVVKKKEVEGEEKDSFAFLKYYNVFKASDITGIDFPTPKPLIDFNPIPACETLVSNALALNACASIAHDESSAYYRPSTDAIHLPLPSFFHSENAYYATLFHEMGHSTGHSSRLNRKGIVELNSFGSHEYSKEELIAELTSAYLCAHLGLDTTLDNSASYIDGWSKKLRDNPKWFIEAAGKAQKAANLLLNKQAAVIAEAA